MKLLKGFKFVFYLFRFGITALIKLLVKRKIIDSQYHFDIDKDGIVDTSITFHGDKTSTEDDSTRKDD